MAKLNERQRQAAMELVDVHVENARERIKYASKLVAQANDLDAEHGWGALHILMRATFALGEANENKLWTTGKPRGDIEDALERLDNEIDRATTKAIKAIKARV